MATKLTYEQSEQRVKELEKKTGKLEQAQEDLKTSKISILDAIPHAVIGIEQRQIFFANRGVETVFGWKPEELTGKSTRALYRSDKDYEQIGRNFYFPYVTLARKSVTIKAIGNKLNLIFAITLKPTSAIAFAPNVPRSYILIWASLIISPK